MTEVRSLPQINDEIPERMRLFDYISRNRGVLRWGEAEKELEMTRDQIEQSVRELTDQDLIRPIESHLEWITQGRENALETSRNTVSTNDPDAVERLRLCGCESCGSPIRAYPPDDIHTVATAGPTTQTDTVEIRYTCSTCGETKRLYWRRPLSFSLLVIFALYLRRSLFPPIKLAISRSFRRLKESMGKARGARLPGNPSSVHQDQHPTQDI